MSNTPAPKPILPDDAVIASIENSLNESAKYLGRKWLSLREILDNEQMQAWLGNLTKPIVRTAYPEPPTPTGMTPVRDAYIALLKLPIGALRLTGEIQTALAILRNEIALEEGRSNEDVQTECESIAAQRRGSFGTPEMPEMRQELLDKMDAVAASQPAKPERGDLADKVQQSFEAARGGKGVFGIGEVQPTAVPSVVREKLEQLASSKELAKYYVTRSGASQLKAELGARMNVAKEALALLGATEVKDADWFEAKHGKFVSAPVVGGVAELKAHFLAKSDQCLKEAKAYEATGDQTSQADAMLQALVWRQAAHEEIPAMLATIAKTTEAAK